MSHPLVVVMQPLVLKAGDSLVPFWRVKEIRIAEIENAVVDIETLDGEVFRATGTDAIEAVMLLKPSALEGRRLKWKKHAWAIHNLVGHPIMQIMAWMGFGQAAVRFHDWTTPTPR